MARPVARQVQRRAAERRFHGAVRDGVRRLAVVRDDRLGDVVVTLPALEALARAYPGARTSLVVAPGLAGIRALLPSIDEVVAARGSAVSLAAEFRERRWDLVVCVSRSARPAIAAALAGVPHRVGPGRRAYSALFHRRVAEPRRSGGRHETEYALSFAHRAGAGPGWPKRTLRVPDDAMELVRGRLGRSGVDGRPVLLHPGSGGSCPGWPVDCFLRLADALAGEGVPVVFSVGPADSSVSRAIDAHAGPASSMPRLGADLVELAALVRAASLVVGSSTGPIHLAAALGVPTLAFHPSWSSCGVERWGPYDASGWALVAEHRDAASWSRRTRRRRAEALMRTITPEIVLGCVLELLAGEEPDP